MTTVGEPVAHDDLGFCDRNSSTTLDLEHVKSVLTFSHGYLVVD